jgi:hypothetical protein
MADFLTALTASVNRSLAGKDSEIIGPIRSSSALIPLLKKDGGYRPIAIGETRRRLISKAANFAVIQSVAEHLSPLQVGVGVRGGTDAVIHSLQYLLSNRAIGGCALVKIDLTNAFNMVARSNMLRQVALVCPAILPFVQSVYGGRPLMFLGKEIIESQVGVQQGDPLGPLLFALAIHPLIKHALSSVSTPLSAGVFYADDGTLIGPPESLAQVLTTLRDEGSEYGVFINMSKSEVWDLDNSDLDLSSLDQFQLSNQPDGVDLLGSFLGSDELADEFVMKRVNAIEEFVKALRLLEDKQMAYLLFQQCLSMPKFNYVLRTLHPIRIARSIEAYERLVRETLVWLTGHRQFDEWHLNRAMLPIALSGTGLLSASTVALPSHIASRVDTISLQAAIIGVTSESLIESITPLFTTFAQSLPATSTLSLDQLLVSKNRQCLLVTAAHKAKFDSLMETQQCVRSRAVATACTCDSGDFLTMIPTHDFPTMSSSEFAVALSLRCDLPVYRQAGVCPACRQELDVYGVHSTQCRSSLHSEPQHLIRRHDLVKTVLHRACQEANISSSLEPRNVLNDGTRVKPADVYLPFSQACATQRWMSLSGRLSRSCTPMTTPWLYSTKQRTQSWPNTRVGVRRPTLILFPSRLVRWVVSVQRL